MKHFEVGRLSGVIKMDPKCHHKCPCNSEAKDDGTERRQCDRGDSDWSAGASSQPSNGRSHRKLEEQGKLVP